MLRVACLSLVASSLVITSCGGGGSNAGGMVAVAPAPTPTPSPTPAPTPSPTPTPTPTPAGYVTYDELTGSREFNSGCGNLFGTQNTSTEGFGIYPTNPEALSHRYDAPTDSWQIRGFARDNASGPEYTYLFGPSDLEAGSTRAATMYRKNDANGFPTLYSIVKRALGATDAQYVRETRLVAKPGANKIDIHCVIGVPTQAADTLPSGSFSYTSSAVAGTALSATTDYDLAESTATYSLSGGGLQRTATLNLVGRAITPSGLSATRTNLGTLTVQSAVDPSIKLIFGALATSNGDRIGTIGGNFFGPQGIELGYGFAGTTTLSGVIVQFGGTVIARR